MLRMRGIHKSFGGVHALKGVDFSCRRREIHVLVGENGAGKSTILKILSGLIREDEGEILLDGKPVSFRNPRQAQAHGIAMVYQELTLLPEMTVRENVYLDCEYRNRLGLIDNRRMNKELREWIDRYDLGIDPQDLVADLPLSKKQMVEILKLLIKRPSLLIFDESTSSLTTEEVQKLYRIMRALVAEDKTVLFISHRMEEVFEIGDRATVFKDGMCMGTVVLDETTPDEVIRMMVGRSLKSVFPPKANGFGGATGFAVEHLRVRHSSVCDVSFAVPKGEILGIAGLQGQGQSELLAGIAGIAPVEGGTIHIGENAFSATMGVRRAIRAGLVLIPEDRKLEGLFTSLNLRCNMAAASLSHRQRFGLIQKKAEARLLRHYIQKLSIKTTGPAQIVSELSGGNQQKVVLSKVLACNPKVMLFNEPTRGIDVQTKQEFYTLMRGYANEGVTVILYSSDLMEVIGLSDRILVIREGRIAAELSGEEINEEAIMRAAVGVARRGEAIS